jgi:hypothetical protein
MELIKGVTKIKWVGDESPNIKYSLFKHKEGIYTGSDYNMCQWVSPEGVPFTYCSEISLQGDKDSEVTTPVETTDIATFKVGDEVGLVAGHYVVDPANPINMKGVIHKILTKDYRVFVKWGNATTNSYDVGELYLWKDIETPSNHKLLSNSNWTDKHYNHYLTLKLTPEDIAAGEVKVKVDPYVVNELWGINTADKTGAGFHCLKTLSRMANAKNSLEREWDALIGQSTRARELLNK